ncbi:hypothetical protein CRG98_010642 [Punica granatum]|uniref:Uncharacterized protein n=1 Tax=Punica granatum TaxID=22663 RepID=A0A2I0KKB7_PUNGR|nr:hypothetical protein CRG98_010642 [Punica granatum]
MRQFGGLQTVPEDMARDRFEYTWREDQIYVDRQSDIEQALAVWRTVVIERSYFPSTLPGRAGFPSYGGVHHSLLPVGVERYRLRQEVIELQRRDQELAQANVALERSKKMASGGPHPP